MLTVSSKLAKLSEISFGALREFGTKLPNPEGLRYCAHFQLWWLKRAFPTNDVEVDTQVLNYTILSEKAPDTLAIIKKAGKQLVNNVSPPTLRKGKEKAQGESKNLSAVRWQLGGMPETGPTSLKSHICSPVARHWFAIQSSFFRYYL